MTCRVCIHEKVCSKPYYGNDIACNNVEELCENFKNKADFVEVVRCVECKYCLKRTCPTTGVEVFGCGYGTTAFGVHSAHYCSYGERRDT